MDVRMHVQLVRVHRQRNNVVIKSCVSRRRSRLRRCLSLIRIRITVHISPILFRFYFYRAHCDARFLFVFCVRPRVWRGFDRNKKTVAKRCLPSHYCAIIISFVTISCHCRCRCSRQQYTPDAILIANNVLIYNCIQYLHLPFCLFFLFIFFF